MTSLHPGGVRLREAVVPDWLTDVMPGWLTEAMRSRPAALPWEAMVRAALAICVPLSVGIAAGRRDIGLLPALGGLLGTMIDTGGPYLVRVRRVLTAAVFGGAAGLVVGSVIHGRGWIAVAALVVIAGVSAVLSRLGATGSVTGLQLLVYSSLGLGPVGALRPWWHTALGFVIGVIWALLLTVPGWLHSPRSAEQRGVAAVYHAIASMLRAIGTERATEVRRAAATTLNKAYDTMLTARSTTGGRSRRMMRLMAVLNASHPLAEAATTLRLEGNRPPPLVTDTIDRLADTIAAAARRPGVPPVPAPWSGTPGSLALGDAMAGLAAAIEWTPGAPPEPAPRAAPRDRVRAVVGAVRNQLRGGRLDDTFALRLMVCVGVAGVASEVLPLQRSYWVVLTAAIVLKPDSGSVFARAVQRGIGTIAGAVLGALILAAVPYGPLLLIPMAVLAASLPYWRSRSFGLLSVFLTPLVVLLIDLLASTGWRLAEERLIDTLLGCAIVLLFGYAAWPMSWRSHLPQQFAATLRDVCRYMEVALVPSRTSAAGGSPSADSSR
ncbi:MAG: FUSC family protein, partial [Trebonia sp.]